MSLTYKFSPFLYDLYDKVYCLLDLRLDLLIEEGLLEKEEVQIKEEVKQITNNLNEYILQWVSYLK